MKEKNVRYKAGVGFILILLLLQACNAPLFGGDDVVSTEPQTTEEITEAAATEEPAPTEELPLPTATAIVHTITPSDPGWVHRWFKDTNSSTTADENQAPGGDDYYNNQLERPFTANEMVYHPDIDIQKAEIASDDDFFYFSIYLKDVNSDTGDLPATYGAEIDTDLDGRGDFLFLCEAPNQTEWAIEMASGYTDSNDDVGGKQPTYPEAPTDGDGYDKVIFSMDVLDDPDGVWCRKAPGSEVKVDIAVKRTLIDSPKIFAWGVWADASLADPALFDYNDQFTYAEAGSPYKVNSNYPINGLYLVDNTCRESYGFNPTGKIPGMCFIPTPEPTATPEIPPTPVPDPVTVSGIAFDDVGCGGAAANNGIYNGCEPQTVYAVTITYYPGYCGSPTGPSHNTTSKAFSYVLPAGNYCFLIDPTANMTTPHAYQVTLNPGGSAFLAFGYYVIQ